MGVYMDVLMDVSMDGRMIFFVAVGRCAIENSFRIVNFVSTLQWNRLQNFKELRHVYVKRHFNFFESKWTYSLPRGSHGRMKEGHAKIILKYWKAFQFGRLLDLISINYNRMSYIQANFYNCYISASSYQFRRDLKLTNFPYGNWYIVPKKVVLDDI